MAQLVEHWTSLRLKQTPSHKITKDYPLYEFSAVFGSKIRGLVEKISSILRQFAHAVSLLAAGLKRWRHVYKI